MALSKAEKQAIFTEYGTHEGDTGSSQVQIAALTVRINQMIEHQKRNIHDNHSRHGLLKMVGHRRSLLKYLRTNKPEEYQALIERLGLRR